MIRTSLFKRVEVKKWGDVARVHENLLNLTRKSGHEWMFRGQKEAYWGLESSLERAVFAFGVRPGEMPDKKDPDYETKLAALRRTVLKRGLNGKMVLEIEKGLVRRFKRQSHHYVADTPDADNRPEWLALMQHYGGPTRLLDWTHSFFVALFFAVEQAEQACTVWAVDRQVLIDAGRRVVRAARMRYPDQKDPNLMKEDNFDRILWRKARPLLFACALNPYRLNERLTIQQGTFLCPGDISRPFEDNLAASLAGRSDALMKIDVVDDAQVRRDILQRLHRMNMNRASLFPGLAGFAESLRTLLVFPGMLRPDPD